MTKTYSAVATVAKRWIPARRASEGFCVFNYGPSLARLDVALSGFKGNALFVYLAQPNNGLGIADALRNEGPKARLFVVSVQGIV